MGISTQLHILFVISGINLTFQIDRKNDYYYIRDLRFPLPELDQRGKATGKFQREKFHRDTILDGEIVMDILEDRNTCLKFLVFDALIVDGKNLMQRNLSTRLGVRSTLSKTDG